MLINRQRDKGIVFKCIVIHFSCVSANLGGQLGLFLGASILSITELIEFVVVVVYTMIQKIINKRQPVSGTPVVEFKQDKF